MKYATALGNSIVVEQNQIQTRESQSPPIEDSTDMETTKKMLYAQPWQEVNDVESWKCI
jgi:hypothetical protein